MTIAQLIPLIVMGGGAGLFFAAAIAHPVAMRRRETRALAAARENVSGGRS